MSDTTPVLIEVVGWMAATLILIGYALVTSGRLQARSRLYQWLNVVGAAGFIVNSGWKQAMPSAVLNVIWLGIGVYTLWSLTRVKNPD